MPSSRHGAQHSASRRPYSRTVAGCCLALAAAVLSGCNASTEPSPTATSSVVKTKCGSDMVAIPAGQFTMGANEGPIDSRAEHVVRVDGFLMDQHEITQEIYEAITGKNPSRCKDPQNPVEQVTWSAAARFCNARSLQEGRTPCYDTNTWECDFSATGYRLPTEAEWEYACRAGSTTQYYYGDNPEELGSVAWFKATPEAAPIRLASTDRMLGTSSTWPETCGNGATTTTAPSTIAKAPWTIPAGRKKARNACSEAAPGPQPPPTALPGCGTARRWA